MSRGSWFKQVDADLLESGRDGDAAAGLEPGAVGVPGGQAAPARTQAGQRRQVGKTGNLSEKGKTKPPLHR